MQHQKYEIEGPNVKKIPTILKKELNPTIEEVSKNKKTFFYVFEKYSFIQNSNMSGTIFLDIIKDDQCSIYLVIAGGKIGLFQLDIFQRENSIFRKIENRLNKICQENNWIMR